MCRRASRGRVYFFLRSSIWGCAGARTKINGPKGGPWATNFFRKPSICGCAEERHENQWTERRIAGGYIFFKDPRFVIVLGEEQKAMGRGAGRGRVYFCQRPSICACVGRGTFQWAEGRAAGGCISFKDPRIVGVLGRNKNQWAEGRAAGGYISFKDPRFAVWLGEEKKQFAEGRAWHHGTMAPRYHGAMAPWYHGTMVPWYHGTMGPSYYGTLVPWWHGTMVPGYHDTTVPWYHCPKLHEREVLEQCTMGKLLQLRRINPPNQEKLLLLRGVDPRPPSPGGHVAAAFTMVTSFLYFSSMIPLHDWKRVDSSLQLMLWHVCIARRPGLGHNGVSNDCGL